MRTSQRVPRSRRLRGDRARSHVTHGRSLVQGGKNLRWALNGRVEAQGTAGRGLAGQRSILVLDFLRQHARTVFDYSSWFYQVLPDKSDREIVSHRLTNWLTGKRRGKPKFPAHLSPEVHALSNRSKTQVRNAIYSFSYEKDRNRSAPDRRTAAFVHRVMPGGRVLTSHGDTTVRLRQVREVKPLRKLDWPRHEMRPAWPSTPTVTELLEMSRRGLTPLPMRKVTHTPQWCLSLNQFNSDIRLASQIVSQQVIGIRSWVSVPRKFLKYFRYRWDFLILTTSWSIPSGLVRFLAAQWKTDPFNLWLKDKSYLKTFLRSRSMTDFVCDTVGPW